MVSQTAIEAQQSMLRTKIKAIYGDSALSESEKAKRIQSLMSPRKPSAKDDTVDKITRRMARVSFNDKAQTILGCSHYQLKAKLLAPCCDSWVSCRFCHDEVNSHAMDRFSVNEMKCMLCQEEQPIAQDCRKCKQQMGCYYCHKCRLIDDGPGKSIFHCDQCGICLSGEKSKFYHCHICEACVAVEARSNHGCAEKKLHCDCPVCGEHIFGSNKAIVQTKCQHMMHEECLQKYSEHSFKCPICSASICDTRLFFKSIEDYMKACTMPREYKDMKSQIHCNDCRQRSVAQYHFVYHKCSLCRSYNTSILSTTRGIGVAGQ
ncbi:zinc-ribbon-domain-containing protein [Kickxella alabastrina]|uniref:zinc-ribbon-domain-containing protein n=1 Tax=Kickxella alabastrina TaxID=61397 RepID=UPI00221E9765|nr:zinc-ribbon-domain-containing protein [Kickxella alabastrina]KAI7824198.1 zinc-ribbon-domain-containing protein [Kickxella alabastrina]